MDYEEPRVKYQTHENGRWYNESGSLRSFLFNISAWQILHTMNSTAHIKIRNEKNFEKMIGDSLFFVAEDKSVILRTNYLTCQNAEKNIRSKAKSIPAIFDTDFFNRKYLKRRHPNIACILKALIKIFKNIHAWIRLQFP